MIANFSKMFDSLTSLKLFLYFFSSSLHSLGILEILLTFISILFPEQNLPVLMHSFTLLFQISISIHKLSSQWTAYACIVQRA